MRFVRSFVFVVWMYGLMAVMAVVCAPVLLGPRSWARACLSAWLTLVFWALRVVCGITYEVRGADKLPTGPGLIAMKHQSMAETILPWRIFKDPAYILKKSLNYLPFFGWYAIKMRNVALDRKGGTRALKDMTKAAKARAAEGRQIVIFPEGTRAAVGAPPDYKPGVAMIYKELGMACTPIALNTGVFWPAHGILRNRGHMVFEVLDPIPAGLDRKTFMAELENRLETATNRLVAEAQDAAGAAPTAAAPSPF